MRKSTKTLRATIYFLFALTFLGFSCSKDKKGGPKISSITPSSVLTGDMITIKGSSLASSSIEIAGIATDVSDNTSTSLTAIVPFTAELGMQEVVVENASGKTTSKINITGVGAPTTITSITPAEVEVGGTITIKGTHLENAAVEIYKKLSTITANTSTSISVIVPSAPKGQVAVGVTTQRGYIVSSVIIK